MGVSTDKISREVLFSAVRKVKYNLLIQNIKNVKSEDPYTKLQIQDMFTKQRLNSLIVDWNNHPVLSEKRDLVFSVLGADIKLSKNDGTSSYGEIISISESPLWHRIIWIGTDDGNIQVSKDGGKKWEEVSRNITNIKCLNFVQNVKLFFNSIFAKIISFLNRLVVAMTFPLGDITAEIPVFAALIR